MNLLSRKEWRYRYRELACGHSGEEEEKWTNRENRIDMYRV